MSRKLCCLLLLATLVGPAAVARAADGETVVRFGSVGGTTDAGLYIADEYGYFRAAGLKVEMTRMDTAPALTTALATGQLDVGGVSLTPGLFAGVEQGINLRIVGDKQSVRPGFSATRFIARHDLIKGTEAETIQGLKGKVIAGTTKAASSFEMLHDVLHKYGVEDGDYRFVTLSFPNMYPAMVSGSIDAAVDLEPFLSQAIQSGTAAQVSDLVEIVPHQGASIVPMVYSEGFDHQHKTALAFMVAYMKGVRVYNDAFGKGIDKDKIITLVARHAGIPEKVVRNGFPAGLDPDQTVSIPQLQTAQQFFIDQHLLRSPIDVHRLVDTSFSTEAVATLGPYR